MWIVFTRHVVVIYATYKIYFLVFAKFSCDHKLPKSNQVFKPLWVYIEAFLKILYSPHIHTYSQFQDYYYTSSSITFKYSSYIICLHVFIAVAYYWYISIAFNSGLALHKKWSFPLRISSVNETRSDLVTFTEDILNGQLHFLYSVRCNKLVSSFLLLRFIFCNVNYTPTQLYLY